MRRIVSLQSVIPRRVLPPGVAFAGAALAFAALYLAAGAPTPLLVQYEKQWGFSPDVLTIAFAVYSLALLAALLTTGSLSDHIGRRPVLIGAVLVELVAMVMFLVAPDIGWVIAARVVQGLATGAATSAFTASIVELAPARHKRLGTVIGSVAPTGGLGLGALLTGAAIQFSTAANTIVFTALSVIMVLGTAVVVFSAETVSRAPGAIRSLAPQVAVPAAARREFAAAVPVHVAAWMLAGLFMGLAPTIIRNIFTIDSGLINGLSGFVAPATAAVAGVLMARFPARRTTLLGGMATLAGGVVITAGVAGGSLTTMLIGELIAGFGFGASFSGALRIIVPLAEPHQRAGLIAGIYVIAYLAFGVPSIIAGQLAAPYGLQHTVIGYGATIVVVAALGLAAQRRAARV
jgi:MFS family permease